MKQRLLLALLVLFASVGMVKAASVDENGKVTLTLPAGKSFTIRFNANAPDQGDISTNNGQANVTNATSNLWTVTSGTGGTLSFFGGTYTSLEIGQGPMGITFSKSVDVDSYSFSQLQDLTINPGFVSSISGYEELDGLSFFKCDGNLLKTIPNKLEFPNGSDPDFVYNVGKQSPEGIAAGIPTTPSNEQRYLTLDQILNNSTSIFLGATTENNTRVSYSNWGEKSSNGTAIKDAVAPYIYRFVDKTNDKLFAGEGEYTCELKTNADNTQFPNVTISKVTVKVANATFTPTITNTTIDCGTINVYKNSVTDGNIITSGTTKIEKKEHLIIASSPKLGYQLTKDQIVTKGLTYIEDKDGQFKYQVTGDIALEVTTTFVSIEKNIQIGSAPNGTVKVMYNGKEISNGGAIPYGAKIEIVPTPNKDYKVNKVMHDNIEIVCNASGKYITTITNATNKIVAEFIPIKIRTVTVNYLDEVEFYDETGLTWVKNIDTYAEQYKAAEGTPITFHIDLYDDINPQTVNIIANGLKLPLQKTEDPDEYMISYTIPTADVEIFTTIKELEPVKVMLSDGQSKDYTGSPIAPVYKSEPNLTDITFRHKQTNAAVWTSGLPTNNGTYIVQFERLSDDIYEKAVIGDYTTGVHTDGCVAFTINTIYPEITAIPTYRKVWHKNNSNFDYVAIQEGTASFNGQIIDGQFDIVDVLGGSTTKTASSNGDPEVLAVRFTPTDGNFKTVYLTTDALGTTSNARVDLIKITTGKLLNNNATLKICNGTKQITDAYNMVPVGTVLTLKGDINDYGFNNDISFIPVDAKGVRDNAVSITLCNEFGNTNAPTNPATPASTASTQYIKVGKQNLNLGMNLTSLDELKEFVLAIPVIDLEADYSGEAYYIEIDQDVLKEKSLGEDDNSAEEIGDPTWNTIKDKFKVTYTDQDGKTVASPIDAGRYTATVECMEMIRGYKYPFVATASFTIKQIQAPITEKGKLNDLAIGLYSTPISIGQSLSQSQLSGPADCEGHYEWAHPDYKVTTAGTFAYEVDFIPTDTRNYTSVRIEGKVNVDVLSKALITFAPVNGKVEVKDFGGRLYNSGEAVAVGTSLLINAVPNDGYKLKSITVDGTTVQTSPYIFTFPDKTVEVNVEFEKLPKPIDPTPTPDPDPTDPANAILVFPSEASCIGKGYRISSYGAKSISFKSDYRFIVSTATSDKENLIVMAGDQVVPANIDGSYTVKADADKAITVVLTSPSKIVVNVEKSSKNPNGYPMGTVEVSGLDSNNSCYYGDKITLVAYPASGVTFDGWTDAVTNKNKLREIEVKEMMTIRPIFKGVPTGIESIADVKVYGDNKCIIIRGLSQGKATIIRMDGQRQIVEINGDTRIDVATGVYGVILEAGKQTIQTKVIVH